VTEETADQDTYKALVAGDLILAEISETPFTIDGENYSPTTVRGDFLSQDEVPGLKSAQMTFRVPCHGANGADAGVAPEFGEALKACGYEEIGNTTVDVTYSPLSTFDGAGGNPGTSYTVALLEDGLLYKMKGCFGNVVFVGEVGIPLFLEFTFTGALEGVEDDPLLTASYDAAVSPAFMGASFSTNFGGVYIPKGVTNFTIDTGNQVNVRTDINETNGVYGARIDDRRSFGSFDPEMVLVATQDWYGIQTAGTTGTITTGLVSGAAKNQYTLRVNRCVLRPLGQTNRDGVRTLEVPFAVSAASTDVEGTNPDIELEFT
jgi:hypothetical protein